MKSCPICNRTFEDTFTFCLADGSLLNAPFDPQATLVIPEPRQTAPPPTEVLKLEETKQEIPPTIASPQPEQKPEDLASTTAAPAPAFESPQHSTLPTQSARKSKRLLPLIGAVAALIILATIAVFYFAKSDGYRIADVWLFNVQGKRTTQFKPNDRIGFSVEVRPEEKTGLLSIRKRLFLIGGQQPVLMVNTEPDLPALAGNPTSFPLSDALEKGKYRLEVVLHDTNKELDTKSVEFEVIGTGDNETSPRARAEMILKKARAGEDFANLARTYSEEPTNTTGGDIGWFGRGVMVKEFEEAAFALQPGQISDIVKTPFGFSIIKMEGRRMRGSNEEIHVRHILISSPL